MLLVAWLDVFTHEPAQNPTVPPWIYQPGLSRTKLALEPQPALGGSRAMVSPMAANQFVTFAASDPKNNFLVKRLGYCANCNVLDAVPKVDGFFSLTPRESDAVQSLFYTTTNASYPGLKNFLGVSQSTAPTNLFAWRAHPDFLPLVTAGQKPVFLDDTNALYALTRTDFDGGKIVFLPPAARAFVTVSNATDARVTKSGSARRPWMPKSPPPNRRWSSWRKLIITTGARSWTGGRRCCSARMSRFRPCKSRRVNIRFISFIRTVRLRSARRCPA